MDHWDSLNLCRGGGFIPAEKDLQILKRAEGDPQKEPRQRQPAPGASAAPTASAASSEFMLPPPEDTGKDIIPVYCSILAAVVVGLLAYVAFKW